MPEHQIQRLFQNQRLHIETVKCPGTHSSRSAEECSDAFEIVLPRRGTFVRHDAAGTTVADVHHALFFYPGQLYQVSHPVTGGDCCTVFGIAPEVLLDLLRFFDPGVDDRPENPFPASYSPIDPRLLHFHFGDDPLAVEERVLMLLGAILQTVFAAMPRPDKATHLELVNQAKVVLGARFCEILTLDQIAQAVYSSPYHLCRVFRRETGSSIHEYLQRLRLHSALELLLDQPHTPLTALALDLGFSSHSHFTTAFRSYFGITPSAFRQRKMSRILKV